MNIGSEFSLPFFCSKFPFLYTPGGISGRPAGILFGKKIIKNILNIRKIYSTFESTKSKLFLWKKNKFKFGKKKKPLYLCTTIKIQIV